jgi:hypothetical protein
MSRGVVDEEARAILIKAGAEAAKRGLKIVSVTTYGFPGEARTFRFGYEPIREKGSRRAKTDHVQPQAVKNDRPRISRGVASNPRPVQESLL